MARCVKEPISLQRIGCLSGFEGSEEQERRMKTGEPKEPVILPYAKVGLN